MIRALAQISSAITAALMAGQFPGRYAAEATGHAALSPEQVGAARAREWRERHGLVRDNDLAFAFENYEDAQVAGGQTLAGQWVTARSRAQEELLPAAAAAVEAASSSRGTPTSSFRARPKPSFQRVGVTLSGLEYAPDKVVHRVTALAMAFEEMGVNKLSNIFSGRIYDEWRQGLERLAQVKCTHSEAGTILNALRTWTELRAFLETRGRQELDLDAFVHTGALAPSRAMASLKCSQRQGDCRGTCRE